MRAIVVTHPTPKNIRELINITQDDYVIAVDQAVANLIDQSIRIDLAVGDFDSLERQALLEGLEVVKLDSVKDVTDTHQALYEAEKRGYQTFLLIGGFGGKRVEHFIANMMHFKRFDDLTMINENSKIYIKKTGKYEIESKDYVSLFAYPEATITLLGFKYPLEGYQLTTFDPLGISNELIKKTGTLMVHQGTVLVVESKK